jgi:hypothetical protein
VGKTVGTAVLYWIPASPFYDGATPLTGYTITYNGTTKNVPATALTLLVTGLTPGENVTFSLVAKNKIGSSGELTASINVVDPPVPPVKV